MPDVQWGRYTMALRRFKWPVITLTLLGAALGFLGSRYVKPVYSARGSVCPICHLCRLAGIARFGAGP